MLFRQSIRDMLRPKTLFLAAVLIALPFLCMVLVELKLGSRFDPTATYDFFATHLVFGFSVVILSIVLGTGVITQEVEQKTIVYLLTRPLPRWRLAMAKVTAAFLLILVTVWLEDFLLALAAFGPGKLGHSSLGRDLAILPLGVLAYVVCSLLLATLIVRPLLPGLLYAFLWESWAPNLPAASRNFSLIAYVRALAPHQQTESDFKVEDLLGALGSGTITPSFAWKMLLIISVVALGLALYFFSVREYVPREETT
jgi:ABC-2 type transport system permease protein